MGDNRICRVRLMVFGKKFVLHVPVHRTRAEHGQPILEQFHLHGRRRRIVAMRNSVIDHLCNNLLVNLKRIIRLCAERMSADAKVELLLDEFNCLVGDFKKIALKPFIRPSRLAAFLAIPKNALHPWRCRVKIRIASKAKHRRTVGYAVRHHLEMCQHLFDRRIRRERESALLAGRADKPANLVLIQFFPFSNRLLFICESRIRDFVLCKITVETFR